MKHIARGGIPCDRLRPDASGASQSSLIRLQYAVEADLPLLRDGFDAISAKFVQLATSDDFLFIVNISFCSLGRNSSWNANTTLPKATALWRSYSYCTTHRFDRFIFAHIKAMCWPGQRRPLRWAQKD